jgi:hypothetical protein
LSIGPDRVYHRVMLRHRLALPTLVGALGVVWAGAHVLAHDIVMQPAAGSDHGATNGPVDHVLTFLPTSLALCLALALAVTAGAGLGRRWTGSAGRSLWLFGLAPMLGFAVDSLLELPVHGHASPSGSAVLALELAPALLVGLAVQIPFALAALGLASRILLFAERLAEALCAPCAPVLRAAAGFVAAPAHARPNAFHFPGPSRSRAPPVPAV